MHPQKQILSPETTSVVCIYDTDGCRSPVPSNCIAALLPAEISPNLVIVLFVYSSSWSFLRFCLSHENAICWFHRFFSGSIRLSLVLYPRVLPYAPCWCFIGPGSCPRCGSFGSDPGTSFPAFWISKRPRRWRLTLRYCVEEPNIELPDAADDGYLDPLYCLVGGTVTVMAAKQPLSVSGTCTHLNADSIRTLRGKA